MANKHHIFRYEGAYGFIGTQCGIKERGGIIYNTGKEMTCLKCRKILRLMNRNKQSINYKPKTKTSCKNYK